MGIKTSFSDASIDAFFDEAIEIIAECILTALRYFGEECVNRIRKRSSDESWIDQTGNLRSSIGYTIFQEGEEVAVSAFQQIGDGAEGSRRGKEYAREIAEKYTETYCMAVVAGMEYAEYVEAKDNKDVLAGTMLWAIGEIHKRIDDALNIAAKRIDRLTI